VNSAQIRQKFIDFFVERGHLERPSLPLAPTDASITTLFTIAGMQQMIPYFLGREEPPAKRMVNVQRAVRTVDIDEVGDDSHLTYLEMLGNFSVGDYFKRESVAFTWEFLTSVMGIPAERWWITHYPGDTEARDGWLAAGVAPERIGETEENWWGPPGPFGPCGPDSEIHYDRGIEYSCGRPDCRPENECCTRFLEIWNNVFMQYFQEENGDRRPLPWNNIDTGMGFERLVCVAQGKDSPYDTDLFTPIFDALTAEIGVGYGDEPSAQRSLRIIADHARAVTMLISDGVMPSAEARGYVVRRLIRRAALRGRMLGIERPFLTTAVNATIDVLAVWQTQLEPRRAHIVDVIDREERRFLETLSRGLDIFGTLAERAQEGAGTISGADAFTLYDTHGFPLELTRELAEERGLVVDEAGFAAALTQQRDQSSSKRKQQAIGTSPETYSQLAGTVPSTVFTGYDELQTSAEVLAILSGGEAVTRAEAGDRVELLFDRTPFYAESGGQVGDTGAVRGDGSLATVLDTQRPYTGFIAHSVQVESGAINVGDVVHAEVDTERRLHILPHHSGTHLLHKALQEVLGPEATQAGSLVDPHRLRFDFRWPRPMTADEVREVQDRVNAAIWANLPVRREIMSYADALAEGAMALFGEKYGDTVRVVKMGEWSKELCGGTHVDATGDIGLLIIVSESGIGSGIRRIEALAGAAAYAYVNDLREQLTAVASALGTRTDSLLTRVETLTQQVREGEHRVEALSRKLADAEAERLVRRAIAVDGVSVVAEQITADEGAYLTDVIDAVKSRLDRGIVVLAAQVKGTPQFKLSVPRALSSEGYNARDLLREAATRVGLKAGGTSELGQGGGGDSAAIPQLLENVVELVRQKAEGNG
jgi:alanyl-tRNA synthetase